MAEHQIQFDSRTPHNPPAVNKLVDCTVVFPVSNKIKLGMVKSKLSGGKISWRDMGDKYDNYTATFNIEVDQANSEVLHQELKLPDRPKFTETGYVGVFPFTPLLDYEDEGEISFVLESATEKTKADDYGNINKFQLKAIPAYKNIYSVLARLPGSETPCYLARTSWSLDSMNLPFPENDFDLTLNEVQNGNPLNGNYSAVDREEVPFLEENTFTVKTDLEASIKFLNLLTTKRDGVYTMTTPSIFAPFGQLYKDNSVFEVIISDEEIDVVHALYNEVRITVKLQLVGVIS